MSDDTQVDPQGVPVATPAAQAPADIAIQDARAAALQAQQRLLVPPLSQVGMHFQLGMPGAPPNELLAKLEPSHLTQVIEHAAADSKREHERKRDIFWGSLVAGVGGFLALCWLFLYYSKPELLKDILLLFTGLFGGFLGGLGFGKVAKKA